MAAASAAGLDPDVTAAITTGNGAVAGEGTGLEPLRGYKRAGLTLCLNKDGEDVWRFSGYAGHRYRLEATAKCGCGRSHDAPHRDCTCGFYAVLEPKLAYGGEVLLEVELYGRIFVGERGYRGEKIRVLKATITHMRCQGRNRLVSDHEHQMIQHVGQAFSTSPAMIGGGPMVVSGPVGQTEGCYQPAKYIDGDDKLLCAAHALHSNRRYYELRWHDLGLEQDLPTEWVFPGASE
jgi:hypothetical protein